MSKNKNFKKLQAHGKKINLAKKVFEELNENELLNLAFNEDEFVPIAYDNKPPKQKLKQGKYALWLEQNGFTQGNTKVHSRVIKYVFLKLGKSPEEIRTIFEHHLSYKKSELRSYFNLTLVPFIPYIDGINIVKFGPYINMSHTYWHTFKEEYNERLKKETKKT